VGEKEGTKICLKRPFGFLEGGKQKRGLRGAQRRKRENEKRASELGVLERRTNHG